MYKTISIVSILFLLVSCRQERQTEIEEVAYWNYAFLDSSFKLLYQDQDTVRSLRYFDSTYQSLSETGIFPQASRFCIKANYYYFFSSDNSATAAMIDSALSFYYSPELQHHYPRTYVGLLLFGGQIAYRLNRYDKANDYYFKAKKLGDEYLNACERSAFNYCIAMVLYRQQNFKGSLQYFSAAYDLQNTCAPQSPAVILQQQEIQSNIGLCYLELEQFDSAIEHFDKAVDIADQHRDVLGSAVMDKIYGVIYGNKARVAMARNDLATAEQLCRQAIALNDKDGYEKEFAQTVKLVLADVYGRKKDFGSMFRTLDWVDHDIVGKNAKIKLDWSRLMASYYENILKPTEAMELLKKNYLLGDSMARAQKQLSAADISSRMNEMEQQVEIAILKKEKQMALVSLWVIIVFSCLVLVIIYLVYQNYSKSKKSLAISLALNEEIKRQKAAREAEAQQRHKLITEAVIQAQENERSLIGLELHDNVNQVLTTVKLHNEMVIEGVGDARTILPRTIHYLQDCINEIRSLSKRLSAPTLGKISLEESVKDLVDSINVTSKVKIIRKITGLDNQVLKQDLHLGVYRILQEQLNNVIKHSGATEVLVEVDRINDNLHLSVTDNGKGFIVSNSKKGIGLVNMQTRAENLNGSFELKTQPGKGCRMEIVLPFNRQETALR